MKKRSPIEMMVDQACGFDPDAPENQPVTLMCPDCKKTKSVSRDKTDPAGTAFIHLSCPDCWKDGGFENPSFFDVNGLEIR